MFENRKHVYNEGHFICSLPGRTIKNISQNCFIRKASDPPVIATNSLCLFHTS